jgi:hypothetical protein
MKTKETNNEIIDLARRKTLTDEQIKKFTDAGLIYYCDDCECYHSILTALLG